MHPTIADEDLGSEAEYRREEDGRFAADPTEADLAWWSEQTRDDAPYDAWYADTLAQDRLDSGCLL